MQKVYLKATRHDWDVFYSYVLFSLFQKRTIFIVIDTPYSRNFSESKINRFTPKIEHYIFESRFLEIFYRYILNPIISKQDALLTIQHFSEQCLANIAKNKSSLKFQLIRLNNLHAGKSSMLL